MTILVVGSINYDQFVYCEGEQLPKPGETVFARRIANFLGGKSANSAVAAARLLPLVDASRAKVVMVGAVGDDPHGRFALEALRREGIDVSNVTVLKDADTGFAAITVAQSGENQVVVVRGANDRVKFDDENDEKERVTSLCRLAVANDVKIVLCQNEIPLSETIRVLDEAARLGRRTIWNLAPMIPPHEPIRLPKRLEILILNETEARELMRRLSRGNESFSSQEITSRSTFLPTLKEMLRPCECENIVVTLGRRGCVVLSEKGELESVPAWPVEKVVDTTGAGDCFVGVLAVMLVAFPDASLARNCARAAKAAGESVKKPGASPSYPRMEELPGGRAFFFDDAA